MIRTLDDLRTRLGEIRGADRPTDRPRVALVSTLGALHDGHVDLIREARERADVVVVSTFVNPLRFRTADETAAYPRSPEADARVLDELGVDVVFAPSAAEFLPAGTATTRVSAGDVGLRYEGRVRPFYFDGVLTVEAKLFHLIAPDVVVYGERDPQRIFLVRRMVRDLDFAVEVVSVPTVRTEDADLESRRPARRGGSPRRGQTPSRARGGGIQCGHGRRRLHRRRAIVADGRAAHLAGVPQRGRSRHVPARRRGPPRPGTGPDRRDGGWAPLHRQRRDLAALRRSRVAAGRSGGGARRGALGRGE
jgi:pantoate--beta-alanine ligase